MSSSSGLTYINKNKQKRKPCFNRKYLKKKKEQKMYGQKIILILVW